MQYECLAKTGAAVQQLFSPGAGSDGAHAGMVVLRELLWQPLALAC
jgi:hypothetical protein